jgi:NitT/TauT family transport system substrate-binding protein
MNRPRILSRFLAGLFLSTLIAACGGGDDTNVVRIPLGAGGVGFLPLQMMREFALVEKHAAAAGMPDVTVEWIDLGGPAVMNDALLAGSVDFIAAGPPAFLTLWDRTRDNAGVRGVAAIAALPMYLNTTSPTLESIDDLGDNDRIAVTAIKVSIPALVMQMYAAQRYGQSEAGRFDRFTVTMNHADALVALLSGSTEINSHFTSPPFHQREIAAGNIRTIMSTDDVLGGATTFTMLSTTRRFHDERPELYGAVLAALREAQSMIEEDAERAARVLAAAGEGGGFDEPELVQVLRDPDIHFTTTPQNVMKYAEFMHEIGSLNNLPESWRDLFFPEIHSSPGG